MRKLIEEAITEKTRAIVPVHYAGVACAMDEIMAIARKHNLLVVEESISGSECNGIKEKLWELLVILDVLQLS